MNGSIRNIFGCHPCLLRAAIERCIIDRQIGAHDESIQVVSSDAYSNLHQRNLRAARLNIDLLPVRYGDTALRRPHQKPFIGVDLAGD